MDREQAPCITYHRTREGEPEANMLALHKQAEAEAMLEQMGMRIVGRFGDPEFAPPFSGWLEPRPGWQLALAEAQAVAKAEGRCDLIILHPGSIGTGDPFLPGCRFDQFGNVRIRVCNFELRAHAELTSLQAAQRYTRDYLAHLRDVWEGLHQPIFEGAPKGEILFIPDLAKRIVLACYSNPSDEPLLLRWQNYQRPLLEKGSWPEAPQWQTISIAARSCRCLRVFAQADPEPSAHWWRFKLGKGRSTKVGNVVFSAPDLTAPSLAITWYGYDPMDHQ